MFLVLRLRSIKFDPFRKRGGEEAGEDKVIALPGRGAKGDTEGAGKAAESGGTPLEQGPTQIKLADRSFESENFDKGAKAAFEMVVDDRLAAIAPIAGERWRPRIFEGQYGRRLIVHRVILPLINYGHFELFSKSFCIFHCIVVAHGLSVHEPFIGYVAILNPLNEG